MNAYDRDWSPLTSQPGETHTIEGRIAAVGVAAHNAVNKEPRYAAYRRGMFLFGFKLLAIGISAVVAASIVVDLLTH